MITTEIEALDYLSALGQEKVHGYEADSDTVSDIVTALLDFQVRTPAVTVGTIDAAIGDLTRSVQADGDSILAVLLRLRDTTGGYIEVDNSRQLNWRTSVGEDKGQQIRYGKNLTGIERYIDYSKLYNRIYAYGEGEGDARIKLRDADGQTEDYVEDTDSQTEWDGVFTNVFVDRSITHPDTLLAWANQLIAEYKDPPITYQVDSIDLSQDVAFEALQLGSTVTVIDEDLGIDVSVSVVRIEHPDLLQPHRMVLELSTRTRDIADTLTEVYDTQQLEQHIATKIGAGQVWINGETFFVDWLTDTQTAIVGDHIRTGVLESNNWGTSAGSQFDLDDGTFKLGGSSSPKLQWNGTTLTVQGTIYATDGEFAGTLKTSDIEAGATLTVNGSIYVGTNKVLIDSSGIAVDGGYIKVYSGGVYGQEVGELDGIEDIFRVWAESGCGLELYGPEGVVIGAGDDYGLDLTNCEFMDLPQRSSNPTGYQGRMYLHTTYKNIRVYDAYTDPPVWRVLDWT